LPETWRTHPIWVVGHLSRRSGCVMGPADGGPHFFWLATSSARFISPLNAFSRTPSGCPAAARTSSVSMLKSTRDRGAAGFVASVDTLFSTSARMLSELNHELLVSVVTALEPKDVARVICVCRLFCMAEPPLYPLSVVEDALRQRATGVVPAALPASLIDARPHRGHSGYSKPSASLVRISCEQSMMEISSTCVTH
jgi:hypothetical protein